MLNKVWAGLILISIVVATITGRLDALTQATLSSAKEGVTLCFTLLGTMSLWMGIMKIAEKGGLIQSLSRRMRPILRFLFPDVPDHHPAQNYIATNLIANMLGLGWAATPAGLKAMEKLQELNTKKDTASRAMCMFLIVNVSSVQLLPVNIMAFRDQFGSRNPAEIIGPALLATMISTLVGIIAGKILERVYAS
ncbi:MAG: nucleoside recognition protein [Epulopiscium sp.]|nr:nucleoside recognition protein [Candidatus Epulonipiscium sp.]